MPIASEYATLFKRIESLAINSGLKIPTEFQNNFSNETIFKFLPDWTNLYIKLDHNTMYFDKHCKPVKESSLQMGDFRAMIQIKGLYIDYHAEGKLASLQLRICQLQNLPKVPTCMFMPMLGNVHRLDAFEPVPDTPQVSNETITLPPTKKGRKTKASTTKCHDWN